MLSKVKHRLQSHETLKTCLAREFDSQISSPRLPTSSLDVSHDFFDQRREQ